MSKPELVIVGLDGLPFSLARKLLADGVMPNLKRVVDAGSMQQMDSVVPTVSSVAWTSFLTGVQPGKHGLNGFIHRDPDSYMIDICSTADTQVPLLPEIASRSGRTVLSMNVPVTTPPREVNGVMIGCFLSNDLDDAVLPRSEAAFLKQHGYRIDTDPMLARQSKSEMLQDIRRTVTARFDTLLDYMDRQPWDLLHVHVMCTDRLMHFLLDQGLGGGALHEGFYDSFRTIDAQVGRLIERLGDDVPLIMLSDHGFEPIRYEVQVSRWMVERGWTAVTEQPVRHPLDFDPSGSRAYTLIPGQFFINLAGREPGGIVSPRDYVEVREQLARELAELTDPETGKPVIRKVYRREELFWPGGASGPTGTPDPLPADATYGRCADLVADPESGYDLKMGLALDDVFVKTELEGMHTLRDATLIVRGVELPEGRPSMVGLTSVVMKTLGLPVPDYFDSACWGGYPS